MNLIYRAVNKAKRASKFYARLGKARRMGIAYKHPGYIYKDTFTNDSVVVDVGCADDPDFSIHMIGKYGLKAFGIDPTKKHEQSLVKLEQQYEGNFKHVPVAVSAREGTITFHESVENMSGSVLTDHTNIMRDEVNSYDVESVTLKSLVDRIDTSNVELIKLDIEGAEYDLLKEVKKEDLAPFKQIYIEFHHHCTKHTIEETMQIVQLIESFGYTSFSLDDHKYLFFR